MAMLNAGLVIRHRFKPSTSAHSEQWDLPRLTFSSGQQWGSNRLFLWVTATIHWVHAHRLWHLWSLMYLSHWNPLWLHITYPQGLAQGPPPLIHFPPSAHAACALWVISSEHRVLAAWKALPHPDQLANSQSSMERRMHTDNGLVQPRSNPSSPTSNAMLSKPRSPPL